MQKKKNRLSLLRARPTPRADRQRFRQRLPRPGAVPFCQLPGTPSTIFFNFAKICCNCPLSANDIIDEATKNNPSNRLTLTSDISGSIIALSHPGADWITGNVIMVDGGEELT